MEELLQEVENPKKKYLIESRLLERLPCQYYSDFLTFNKNDFNEFNVDFNRLNEFCSIFPIISNQLAYKYYNQSEDYSHDITLRKLEVLYNGNKT